MSITTARHSLGDASPGWLPARRRLCRRWRSRCHRRWRRCCCCCRAAPLAGVAGGQIQSPSRWERRLLRGAPGRAARGLHGPAALAASLHGDGVPPGVPGSAGSRAPVGPAAYQPAPLRACSPLAPDGCHKYQARRRSVQLPSRSKGLRGLMPALIGSAPAVRWRASRGQLLPPSRLLLLQSMSRH